MPFQVSLAGEPASGFASDKVRALLAYLALSPESPHRREALAGLLWPEFPERSARSNLRNALANLRRVTGDGAASPPFLHITRQTIQFNSQSDYWLDADTFEGLVAVVPPMSEGLEQAVSLVRGNLLEGFSLADAAAFEEWLLLQREHFCRQVVEALDSLVAIYEGNGAYELALAHARRRVELEPWQEEGQRQLMRLLVRSGHRSEALNRYEVLCRSLHEELGAEPSAETRALNKAILSGKLAQEPALRPGPPAPIWNLPASPTPFFGRVDELAALEAKLTGPDARLVTVTGLGGSGKTRLALEVGAQLAERERQALDEQDRRALVVQAPVTFPHGIVFVPLAALDSVEGLDAALADALQLRLEGGREQLLDFLRRRQLLLILDNLERLSAGAGLLAEILRIAPGVKILATSRERIQVQGEHVLPLGGLPYPEHDLKPCLPGAVDLDACLGSSPALQLLSAAIQRAQPRFVPSAVDLPVMLDVCRLVDGLPLALELAASWADALSLNDILVEARRSLDFWQVDWPDLPERQCSIRAVFDVSWRRLNPAEQAMFSSLTVFRGGFAREAAGQVVAGAEAIPRRLAALVRKSFLRYDLARDRYGIHELLRQFGAEKLAQEPAREAEARDLHSAYYVCGLQRWEADLLGSRQQTALSEMEAESENIRTAWECAIEGGQVEQLAQMMDGLQSFYWRRGRYQEGEAAFQRATASLAGASDVPARVLSRALAWRSSYCQALGDKALATRLQSEAMAGLEKLESRGQEPRAEKALLYWLMGRRIHVSDYDQAQRWYEKSLDLYRHEDDLWGTANVLDALGSIARLTGAMSQARRLCEEGLAIRRVSGDRTGIAKSTVSLAEIALHQGRYEESEYLAQEGIAECQQLGDQVERAYGLHILGAAMEMGGEFPEALPIHEQSLDIFQHLGRRHYLAAAQSHLASTMMHLGQYEEARDHAVACLVLARETDLPFKISQAQRLLGALALAGGGYAECRRQAQASLAACEQTGHGVDLGLAHVLLAHAARGLGDPETAQRHLSAALPLMLESGANMEFLRTLCAAALVLADQGAQERAVEVYSSLLQFSHVAHSRWFADVAGNQLAALAATLPAERVAIAEKRGQTRDLEVTAAELLTELCR
jgi:DNA-binding SARP family transcriptional activator/predicted ATPase